MRILLVAATSAEIAPLVQTLGRPADATALSSHRHRGHDIDVLVTGVGMVATAAWTSRACAEHRYDLALNVGVCGSFAAALQPGTVVHIVSDRIAELGAEDDERFISVEDLGLPAEHMFVNAAPPDSVALRSLPMVSGITVNTVHGRAASIADVMRRFHPDVESMEGASFMHACSINRVAFAQVRAVSNVVEKRNRDGWKLNDAIAALNTTALAIIEDL